MKRRNKAVLLSAWLALVASIDAFGAVYKGSDDGRILSNPDRGLVIYYYSNVPDHYGALLAPGDSMKWFPGSGIVYLRLPWSMVEPEEGVFDWSTLDTPAQRWIAKGGQIALRITCSEDWTYYATPKWVRDAGAKGAHYRNMIEGGAVRTPDGKTLPWDPDFGDPVFLAKLEKFVAAFAARYDGRPEVAFVDIGSYGLWGEGHTFGSSRVPDAKRAVDIPRHIDLWCRHFKRTQLFISDDIDGSNNRSGKYPLLDYARSKGVAWRDDSILCEPAPREWYHADQAERYWQTLPVALEHGHYGYCLQIKSWSRKRFVDAAESMHASYMSVHGDPSQMLAQNRQELEFLAARLGYRFRVESLEWPDVVTTGKHGEAFDVGFAFSNGGFAPCYRDAYPCLTVKNGKGGILAVLVASEFNLRSLTPAHGGVPARTDRCTTRFRLGRFGAPTYPDGNFDVFVSVGTADGTPVYELPMDGGDGQRRYKVGKLSLKKGKAQ